jgi:hypothetical protein
MVIAKQLYIRSTIPADTYDTILKLCESSVVTRAKGVNVRFIPMTVDNCLKNNTELVVQAVSHDSVSIFLHYKNNDH